MTGKSLLAGLLALGVLSACGGQDVILSGERLDIRADLDGDPQPVVATPNEARPISLPDMARNSDWTHRNGGPEHAITHPALPAALAPAFAVNIGDGDSRRHRITADPVVAAGRVFTLDARSQVVATSTAGETLWSRSLAPASDNLRDASGGGLASDGATVLVNTGFGELVALDAASGTELWVQDLDAPGTSAPTIRNGLAYVVARDSRAWAVDMETGRVRWTLSGTPPTANFAGGAGAAVTPDIAVFPFPTGEVMAAFPQGGLRRWASNVTGQRPGQAASTISDLAGDPVIDGDRVYVGNLSGRLAALRLADGDRIWTVTEGAVGPVWPVGGSVFMVNDLGEVLRLDATDGSTIWRVELPGFVERRERRQSTRYEHYGPVLAGGRLIVASSDGLIRQFDPVDGSLIGTLEIRGGATSNPVVADGTLYVLSKRGQLLAFR
ncbi:PQQ-like beta-propeller repeat protein [Salibaculum griseiflavum]|uniref:Quinoprotein n=1 Tax=Salibaculum griseiflavum TaxID=1914409 RepID=A0A2V1P242_9RHOB|nr:PQQ-like beta-propeller repeat protein [Salibaculum griseiflavum]PWG16581.1 quinoprotein [Salibaculum griseiflavum]